MARERDPCAEPHQRADRAPAANEGRVTRQRQASSSRTWTQSPTRSPCHSLQASLLRSRAPRKKTVQLQRGCDRGSRIRPPGSERGFRPPALQRGFGHPERKTGGLPRGRFRACKRVLHGDWKDDQRFAGSGGGTANLPWRAGGGTVLDPGLHHRIHPCGSGAIPRNLPLRLPGAGDEQDVRPHPFPAARRRRKGGPHDAGALRESGRRVLLLG